MGWIVKCVPASRRFFQVLGSIALFFVSGVSFSETVTVGPFVDSIRADRPSGGFRAFLEVRDGKRALKIVEITPDGPADRAGLEVGDLIFALDGSSLPCWNSDLDRVKDFDRLYSAGDVVTVSFTRLSNSRFGETEQAPRETKLELDPMAVGTQEELIRWVAIAEQRLAEGDSLYCHDVRASESGTHHVCHDDSDRSTRQP